MLAREAQHIFSVEMSLFPKDPTVGPTVYASAYSVEVVVFLRLY